MQGALFLALAEILQNSLGNGLIFFCFWDPVEAIVCCFLIIRIALDENTGNHFVLWRLDNRPGNEEIPACKKKRCEKPYDEKEFSFRHKITSSMWHN